MRDGAAVSAQVEAALAAAQIPRSKLGAARRARLNASEQELYLWILRRFASSGRPSRSALEAAAEQFDADLRSALATLSREDLIHFDKTGEIAVAYPFSGRPTPHSVRFPNGHKVDAMCALDALGIAPMFGEPIEIESRDPVSGDAIRARVAPDASVEWAPEPAVVVAGSMSNEGEACGGCCPVLNFFASSANAERWLAAHPQVSGTVITIEDATAAGRTVFGDALKED
jgi:hypothetical protein